MPPPPTILILLACVGLSFLLSGMEAGVFALSRLRIRHQMRTGNPSARVLYGYLERPENFLWTILVGNTVANFVILGVLISGLHAAVGHRPGWFAGIFLVLVFAFYAWCDLLPKMLFRMFPNRLCLLMARPFRFLSLGLRPLVALVEWVSQLLLKWTGGKAFTGNLFGSREELRWIMQESAQTFTSEERAMISRVLDLQSLTVRQITTPLTQAVTVRTDTPVKDVLALCRQHNLTRLPVWEARPDRAAAGPTGSARIVGIVSLQTLLYRSDWDESRPTADFLQPAVFLEENLRLEEALKRMQRSGQRLAVVLGRDQRETGIVSLTDILTVIFGEVSL